MFFSKIQLHPQADSQLVRELERDQYRLHQVLWRLFPQSDKRDFLFRRIEQTGTPAFYLVSQQEPQDAKGLWQIQSKPYQPRLQAGQRLGFSLLANPVVSRRDAESGKAARHDIVLDAHRNEPETPKILLQQRVGQDWLASRGEQHGFTVSALRVDGYQQHRLRGKGGRPIRFSTLTFDGELEVTDPEQCLLALQKGIGPAKAFGCGLLLVRRV